MSFRNLKHNQRGTTILELIVVLAVFAILVGITVGMFSSSVERQRYQLKEQDVVNQSGFVTEYMARKISDATTDLSGRCLGTNYINYDYVLSNQDQATGMYQGITFLSRDGACYNFSFDGSQITEVRTISASEIKKLLPGDFTIQYLRFILDGDKTMVAARQSDSSQIQPRVTFALNIHIPLTQGTGFREKLLQTTISKRNFALTTGSGGGGGGGGTTTCNALKQCVVGGGGQACTSDNDCGTIIGGGGTTCNALKQCVVGGGGQACTSSSDCGITGGGGGGGTCYTGICPPQYVGVPCPCCTGYHSTVLNNGNYACVPDQPGGGGGGGFP